MFFLVVTREMQCDFFGCSKWFYGVLGGSQSIAARVFMMVARVLWVNPRALVSSC